MDNSSQYINDERREYALYVLSERAIPHAADGLKPAARRCLWVARQGGKFKTASLAGAAMPLHPHAAPTGAIETLTGPYLNNIPLFEGDGAFGTLLNPRNAMAAPRYTSVKVSKFCKDVVFKDIEIVPMQENYDGTLQEPKHFLPLVPIVLLNPQEGIAVGFATTILPRALDDIIKSQLDYLEGKEYFYEGLPNLTSIGQQAVDWYEDNGNYRYIFHGEFERTNTTTITITNLPYGITHEKFIDKLTALEDDGFITSFEDNSRDKYDIIVKFKRETLKTLDDEQLLQKLNLVNITSENLNVINFDGKSVWSATYEELIQHFCDWRLQWYIVRYQRLSDLLEVELQRYRDIIKAINKNVGGVAKKVNSRSELKEYLESIKIVHLDYIADLPVYRFTIEEKEKVTKKLEEGEKLLKYYQKLLKSEQERKKIYIIELQDILSSYKRGNYDQQIR